MGRKLRFFKENKFYHIYSRGSRKDIIFNNDKDYYLFLDIFMKYSEKYNIVSIVYSLLPNHFHFIIYIINDNIKISRFFQVVLSIYAKEFNKLYKNSGAVYQGRFKHKEINTEEYFLKCCDYIHLNPVKAKLIEQSNLYEWSSCKFYFNKNLLPKNYKIDMRYLLNYYDSFGNDPFLNYKNHLNSLVDKKININFELVVNEKENLGIKNRRNKIEVKYDLKRRKSDKIYLNITKLNYIIEKLKKYYKIEDFENILNNRIMGIRIKNIFVFILLKLTDLKYKEIGEIFGVLEKQKIYSLKIYIIKKMEKKVEFKNYMENLLDYCNCK